MIKDAASDSNIGKLLINRYQLIELIGKGAMGRVYLAEDTLLGGVPVAIKFLAQTLLTEQMRVRFAHEARSGALLGQKSIHIVRVIDYGVNQDEVPFYVMEYLPGANLDDLISTQPLPLPRFLNLARHICLGLQCAHQGIILDGKVCPIIHRDIKPGNVLVIQDPSLGELAKILDFGIAKFLSDQTHSSRTSSFLGTLAYSSPEQMEGCELDGRSDIYSLGVMLFEMLTGQLPLQPGTHSIGSWYKAHHFQAPSSFKATSPTLKLPKLLEDLVMGCLAKAPSDRPQTTSQILETLQLLEQHLNTYQKADKPVTDPQPEASSTTLGDEVLWQATWPSDKPVAEIVFPYIIQTQRKTVAAVWAMLPQAEIQKRLLSTRYNQFLYSTSPHPMVLWITAIYEQHSGPRWLSCYLDLKNRRGLEILGLLGETGHYPLLLFALETPRQCANVMTFAIAPNQRQLLRDWLRTSQNLVSVASPTVSKSLLKAEFEKIKPKILSKLKIT